MSDTEKGTGGSLAAALVKAWADIPSVVKDRENSHFRNSYATYDAIVQATRPVLAKHGLAMMQLPGIDPDGRAIVRNTLVHKSGEVMDLGAIAVPAKDKSDPQKFGSAVTYAKRYAWCAALAVPTGDDDDANGAAAVGVDPRHTAYKMVGEWSGLTGSDLTQAAKQVSDMAGSKDPEVIIAYIEKHKGSDFIEHVTQEGNE